MKRKELFERIAWVPAWGLSLFSAILSAVVVNILKEYDEVTLTYIIWSMMSVIASFLICVVNPVHVWIVPLLCNILVLLPAACDDTFWNSSFGIIIGSGVVLSVIMSHLGALIGKRIDHPTTN
jgi:hypothetical protein